MAVNLRLTDELRAFVETAAHEQGCSTEEFIHSLLQARKDLAQERQRIEADLDRRLNDMTLGKGIPMDAADWARIRQQVRDSTQGVSA